MKFRILSAREYGVRLKATIHSTGKLGFTEVTAVELKLSTNSAISFAIDELNIDVLYLIVTTKDNLDAFKVAKAGAYFYVDAKGVFDKLGIDYKNNSVIFDLVKTPMGDMEVYKLLKREKPRVR